MEHYLAILQPAGHDCIAFFNDFRIPGMLANNNSSRVARDLNILMIGYALFLIALCLIAISSFVIPSCFTLAKVTEKRCSFTSS